MHRVYTEGPLKNTKSKLEGKIIMSSEKDCYFSMKQGMNKNKKNECPSMTIGAACKILLCVTVITGHSGSLTGGLLGPLNSKFSKWFTMR